MDKPELQSKNYFLVTIESKTRSFINKKKNTMPTGVLHLIDSCNDDADNAKRMGQSTRDCLELLQDYRRFFYNISSVFYVD